MIQAAIFDLDGTLLNRDASVNEFITSQYERLDKWLRHIPKESYITRFIELDQRGYVWKDEVYKQLIEEFTIPEITWEELLEDYISEFKHNCVPFPHLHKMLEELREKNIKLGMITNGFGQFQMDNILALEIEAYFDEILVSEWEGLKKPDPEIFKRALVRLNLEPHECIFIGDHPEYDVYGAQKVGMKGIWKKDPHLSHAEQADGVIDDLMELPIYIDHLNSNGR
ncbi:HAD family hydrolase [Rossellomorea aquimaris]|uniref:Putative hydrolase of the HAD superfamily n=1 Tax=Rossellomorea aquimaris TaxID=189382 RepID=A0A366EZU1_9BACI|nr:HAD family hydrolase [Rossellomorea aquimaris]RBP07864.1 putative hydrolase of the HAD superfamily [Rossellomorea aquimaris]